MKQNQLSLICLLTAMVVLVTACKKEVKSESEDIVTLNAVASNAQNAVVLNPQDADFELLKSVRQATSRFHSTTQAIKAGYQPTTHCVISPAGGMGYHWVNPSLVDGTFDPLKPEVLLYEKNANGSFKLTGLEYIVLKQGRPDSEKPSLGSQPFDLAGAPNTPPNWTLHVWLYKQNPLGMFVRFNPDVTCP